MGNSGQLLGNRTVNPRVIMTVNVVQMEELPSRYRLPAESKSQGPSPETINSGSWPGTVDSRIWVKGCQTCRFSHSALSPSRHRPSWGHAALAPFHRAAVVSPRLGRESNSATRCPFKAAVCSATDAPGGRVHRLPQNPLIKTVARLVPSAGRVGQTAEFVDQLVARYVVPSASARISKAISTAWSMLPRRITGRAARAVSHDGPVGQNAGGGDRFHPFLPDAERFPHRVRRGVRPALMT